MTWRYAIPIYSCVYSYKDIHTSGFLKVPSLGASLPVWSLVIIQAYTEHHSYAKHPEGLEKQSPFSLPCRSESKALPTNEPVITSVHASVEESQVASESKLPHLLRFMEAQG